ncbi:MAG TPA: hypothetical protein VMU65_06810 [Candidatus Saccharimonadales bacterium]|nr:hypothetical protein [Candidatus Saccharimonadales bacterium]
MRRRAIAIGAMVVVAFFAVTLITLTHVISSGQGGCAIPAPAPNLPAQLRSLGGFDQSFDANNPEALAEVAATAAGAVDPDLDGTTQLAPVAVAALAAGQPGALVVPLEEQQTNGTGARVAGLVSFFVGCGGRAYFGSVVDLSAVGSGTTLTFPTISRAEAAAQLGTTAPQLVYTTSPFTPEWRNPQSGMTIAAGE